MSSLELTARLLRYPLDLSGVNPDNFVEAEVRELPNHRNRAVVLSNGAFFTDSLVVYDNITGELLTKKTQYIAAQLVEAATVRSGKEICSIIIVTDPAVSNQIRVDYQVVGGPYILNVDALIDMVNTLDLDNRPITWGAIIGKPDLFPPGNHLHDAGDVFGFEYMVLALEEIRKAILMGDIASHDELRNYTKDVEDRLTARLDSQGDALNAHKADNANPHQTTKAQVGLGNVDNYATASQAEAEAGTSNSLFMTPLRVAQEINTLVMTPLNNHLNDFTNPHQTTKAQVGLGNVQNYDMASQADAEAGTAADHYMSPLTVKQAISAQAIIPLLNTINTHVNRTDNPHATTKAQVGLGSVENYAPADYINAIGRTVNALYMTPLSVAWAIDDRQAGYDARYVRKGVGEDTSLTVSGNMLYAWVSGAWRVVWPPQWQ